MMLYKIPQQRAPSNAWPIAFVTLSLFIGFACYLLWRINLPVIAPIELEFLHRFTFSKQSHWLTHCAPSFFHAYAMSLATLAVPFRSKVVQLGAFAMTIICCLGLEIIQHPLINRLLIVAITQTDSLLSQYARFGVFDLLDLGAIIVAISVALFHARHLKLL